MRDALDQKEFALKKIRCLTGAESVEVAMREIAAYRRFKCVLCILFLVRQLRIRVSGTLTSSDYT
jgi:hypothetical protein